MMDTLRRMPRAYGVNITRAAVFIDSSEGIRVTDSMLAGAGSGVGLCRKHIGPRVLSQSFYGGNTITNFTYGIHFEEVNNAAIITRNTLANNTVGLLLNNSSGNTIYHNNFISNGQQVMTVGTSRNIWNKNSDGNYWSDYTGLDEDKDGKGDSPYTIDEQNQDNYPFMKKLIFNIIITNITPLKTVVSQGYTIKINATIANQGDLTETFNITVYANATAIETKQITLISGVSINITFTWNTVGFAKGNYMVWAYAWPVLGEVEVEDNTFSDGFVIVVMVGDLNNDGVVDIRDISIAGRAYGSYPGHPRWNPNADINNDNIIDIRDISTIGRNFGKTDP